VVVGLAEPLVLVPLPGAVPDPVPVPLPFVVPPPLPPELCDVEPLSTLVPTPTNACRSGGMASVMLAMNTTPASTATGRSQAVPVGRQFAPNRRPAVAPAAAGWGTPARVASGGISRSRGHDRERGSRTELGRGKDSGHAQWPSHTKFRARLRIPRATLSSHG
jgi:hypothetical protein